MAPASSKKRKTRRSEAGPLLTPQLRKKLVGLSLGDGTREALGLVLPVPAYAQDPEVALERPKLGIIDFKVNWRPGLSDGPTSGRVAVVDYDADLDKLYDPAIWNEKEWRFEYPAGQALSPDRATAKDGVGAYPLHQVGVWATVECALAVYEDRDALGRALSWGFPENRLIVVPHAGQDDNAYYDRSTKSLQFYYFDCPTGRGYTCLSHEIVAHETGHALLDGIRPLYNGIASAETVAFHECVADLTQLFCNMRNNPIRHEIGKAAAGQDLDSVGFLYKLGEQFAKSLYAQRDSIRNLKERVTRQQLGDDTEPHRLSQVLTNALFKIIVEREKDYRQHREKTTLQSLWNTTRRSIQVALQPLDYCPPVDVRFADYAAALLCRDELLSPRDEHGYRTQMCKILEERGIACRSEKALALTKRLAHDLNGANFYALATSRPAIYRFLHEHRRALAIPPAQDLMVLDPSVSSKSNREAANLPRELVIQYVWGEPVLLEGKRYGTLQGETVSLLCGGTLVFNENGCLLYASLKPGTQPVTGGAKQDAFQREGEQRREELTRYLAQLAQQDAIAFAEEVPSGHLGAGLQAIAHRDAHGLRLESAPRLHPGEERKHWRYE